VRETPEINGFDSTNSPCCERERDEDTARMTLSSFSLLGVGAEGSVGRYLLLACCCCSPPAAAAVQRMRAEELGMCFLLPVEYENGFLIRISNFEAARATKATKANATIQNAKPGPPNRRSKTYAIWLTTRLSDHLSSKAKDQIMMRVPLLCCILGIVGLADAFTFMPQPPVPPVSLSPSALVRAQHHVPSKSSASIRPELRSSIAPLKLSSNPDDEAEAEAEAEEIESIDTSADERLNRVRLPRATTIEWGTDLSFSFVYVRALEPAGAADLSGQVAPNDQLCELRPVLESGKKGAPISLIGAPFDTVMSAFATLDKTVREVDLVFFRGSKDELKELCTGDATGSGDGDTITITVVQNKGGKDEAVRTLTAPSGCNVRQVLVDHDINVYQSLTRWTNCKGKQLCGTCIVNVADGGPNTNRKSMDEGSTLRENPDGYRLSCVTFAYGDVTVETFPPIKAAQWTR